MLDLQWPSQLPLQHQEQYKFLQKQDGWYLLHDGFSPMNLPTLHSIQGNAVNQNHLHLHLSVPFETCAGLN